MTSAAEAAVDDRVRVLAEAVNAAEDVALVKWAAKILRDVDRWKIRPTRTRERGF